MSLLPSEGNERMAVEAALQVLVELRTGRHVVVTNQGSARLWPRLSQHAGDFHYNPSTMGGAVPLGLGIALACPDREVIVVSGDGSLLMSLGCLVTVIDSQVTNLTIVLLDNAMYEVTGGQSTAATRTATDFPGMANAAGFPVVGSFRDELGWRQQAPVMLSLPGPRFLSLAVSAMNTDCLADTTEPIAEQLKRLQQYLAKPLPPA
jgi:sulfopyruvate decarboxylase subunit beta